MLCAGILASYGSGDFICAERESEGGARMLTLVIGGRAQGKTE